VGLIKGYGWQGADGTINYATNGVPDMSANGMYTSAKRKGNISTIPEVPGLAVRFDGHIGVYIGKGDVVEARGFAHGIVTTKLAARPWTHWLEVPWIDYSAQTGSGNNTASDNKTGLDNKNAAVVFPLGFGERTLRFGSTGDDVKALQRALIQINYSVGALGADGDFGEKTESAVKAYQTVKNIIPDGIVGPFTRAALEADLPDTDAMEDSDAVAPPSNRPQITISGGNAFIRNSPNTTGMIKGVAKTGDQFDYMGETSMDGWQSVNYHNELSWVSGKYAKTAG
jgi:hypothetical protein